MARMGSRSLGRELIAVVVADWRETNVTVLERQGEEKKGCDDGWLTQVRREKTLKAMVSVWGGLYMGLAPFTKVAVLRSPSL